MAGHHSKKKGKKNKKSKQQQNSKKKAQQGHGGGQQQQQQQSTNVNVQQQLHQIGAYVHEVPADGNCLFRSLYDQLECLEDAGGVEDHVDLRKKIVQEISAGEEFFSCFIEDDESFEDYIDRMSEEDVWGGNIEIQAFSTLFHVNVRIFQSFQASWTILNFPEESARMVHISYHDGNHYNSVRDRATGKPLSCCPRVNDGILASAATHAHGAAPPKQHSGADRQHDEVDDIQEESHDIRVEIRVRHPQDTNHAAPCNVCFVMPESMASRAKKPPKAKNTCPCGSNKKYKKCCKKREKRMEHIKALSESAEDSLAHDFTTNIYV